uniref:Uncharacterized protein n=1 Tax=Panagrolaimus sp. ES5 TaxID=591445 RepID=A0AC34GS78_9BILA
MASTSSSQPYYKLLQWQHFPTLYDFIYRNFLCNNDTNISAVLEEALSFPHSCLDEVWDCYRTFQDYPNTSDALEKYKKSKKLYQRLIRTDGYARAWFDCLLEVGDDEFVIQNVEDRIQELDKELWHIYIHYLHGININAAHEVYTRYLNSFLDDTSLDHLFKDYSPRPTRFKKEYIKSRCNSLKPWERATSPPPQPRKSRKRKHGETAPKVVRFSKENQARQYFTFPLHTMECIAANANPAMLEKLYQSCKYFYAKRPSSLPILRTLIIDRCIKRGQKASSSSALTISETDLNSVPSNLTITMALHIKACSSNSIFSILTQKIYHSQIRFLRLSSQSFTLAEFERFINPNLLEYIHLEDVDVLVNDRSVYADFDKILALLPAAKYIEMNNSTTWFGPETLHNIHQFTRKNQFKHFVISEVNALKDIACFCNFLRKNITEGSKIGIKFDKNVIKFPRYRKFCNKFFKRLQKKDGFKNINFDISQG